MSYITCKMCCSPNMELTRDPYRRLKLCKCHNCSSSSRRVTPISSRYYVMSRAERRAVRTAAG